MTATEKELREIEIHLVPPMKIVNRDQCGFTPKGFRFFLDFGNGVPRCFIQTKSRDGKQRTRTETTV